jgi:hypothetical protein
MLCSADRDNAVQRRSEENEEARQEQLKKDCDKAKNCWTKHIHQNIAKRCTIEAWDESGLTDGHDAG